MSDLSLQDGTLQWGAQSAPVDQIQGFAERYGPWTGRAWLEVRGPGWRIPFDSAYARRRRDLRRWFPDRPFASDWMDGRFPSAPVLGPAGGRHSRARSSSLSASQQRSPHSSAGSRACSWWRSPCGPLGRLRDRLHVSKGGLRAGPAWSTQVDWFDVKEVRVHRGPRRSWGLRARRGGGGVGADGVAAGAARATEAARWAGAGRGGAGAGVTPICAGGLRSWACRGGVAAGALAVAFFTPTPWTWLAVGALTMMGATLLAAMGELGAPRAGASAVCSPAPPRSTGSRCWRWPW